MLGPNIQNINKIIDCSEKFSTAVWKNRIIKSYYTPSKEDKTLVFESRFESGNLDAVLKVSDNEYNLILQNDINTKGNTQWFFFYVKNTCKDLSVKFNIINLGKQDSLFNQGMKILVYSETRERNLNIHWTREGEEVFYCPNALYKQNKKPYYTLTFTYKFLYADDKVYFAYSHPYTYTDLMKYLVALENNSSINNNFSRRLLCKSIGGNRCDYLSITSPDIPEYMKNRKGVVFTARAHPGETVSSWVMHGVIDFLTGNSKEAELIRNHFIVKVVPMLNPDGVINGNYRTNLAGIDLNRKWNNPGKILTPTISSTKKLIKKFSDERQIELLCDLHGHSRSMNIFMYGCNNPSSPEDTRLFPLILSKLSTNFRYDLCSFKMQKFRESTLRISMFNELKIPNVFTLETSFCGSNGFHYTINDLMSMGKTLCMALLVNCNLSNSILEIRVTKQDIIDELKQNKHLLEENPDNFSDSDSDPSEDNLEEEILKNFIPYSFKKNVKKVKSLNSKTPNIEKKSFSTIRKREKSKKNNRKNFSFEKKLEVKKCEDCGATENLLHCCIKKNKNSFQTRLDSKKIFKMPFNPNLCIYINGKGKAVRDQSTQTLYTKKLTNSESYCLYNSSVGKPASIKPKLLTLTKKTANRVLYDMGISLATLKNKKTISF